MRQWNVKERVKERRTNPEIRPAPKKGMPVYAIAALVALAAVAFSLLPPGLMQRFKDLALKVPGARSVISHPLTCGICKYASRIWVSARRMLCSNLRACFHRILDIPVVRMASSKVCCLWASMMRWISSTLHIPMGKFQNLAQMSREKFSSVVEKVNEKKIPVREKIDVRSGA